MNSFTEVLDWLGEEHKCSSSSMMMCVGVAVMDMWEVGGGGREDK